MTTETLECAPRGAMRQGDDRLLRLALQFDEVATGAVGTRMLAAGAGLDDLLGTPLTLHVPAGLVLLAYAAALWAVGSRPVVSRPAARAAVIIKLLWAVASVTLVAAGPFSLNALGRALLLAQAAAVALFADLQFLGPRRARSVGR